MWINAAEFTASWRSNGSNVTFTQLVARVLWCLHADNTQWKAFCYSCCASMWSPSNPYEMSYYSCVRLNRLSKSVVRYICMRACVCMCLCLHVQKHAEHDIPIRQPSMFGLYKSHFDLTNVQTMLLLWYTVSDHFDKFHLVLTCVRDPLAWIDMYVIIDIHTFSLLLLPPGSRVIVRFALHF